MILNASDKPTLYKKVLRLLIQNICTAVLRYITQHHSNLEKSLLLNYLEKVSFQKDKTKFILQAHVAYHSEIGCWRKRSMYSVS